MVCLPNGLALGMAISIVELKNWTIGIPDVSVQILNGFFYKMAAIRPNFICLGFQPIFDQS